MYRRVFRIIEGNVYLDFDDMHGLPIDSVSLSRSSGKVELRALAQGHSINIVFMVLNAMIVVASYKCVSVWGTKF